MNMTHFFQQKAGALLLSFFSLIPVSAQAGGIVLGGTRIIYPLGSKQEQVSIHNTDKKITFLVQSWVESADGQKTKDFVVTPPLYTSAPGNENMLRLVSSSQAAPKDRESLFFFNAKAIPAVDKNAIEGKNALIIATVTRIKLFVRPAGLKPEPEAAPSRLRFRTSGGKLMIMNPTPYYLTLANLKSGHLALADTMVAPLSESSVALPPGAGGEITFSTVNDYGGMTPLQKGVVQ